MSRAVQEGYIASCGQYFMLPDRTHTWRTPISVSVLCCMLIIYVADLDLHGVHGLSYPLTRLLLRLTVTFRSDVCNLLSHSLHCMILGENSAGFTLRKKQFRDFSLLSAGCCPYRVGLIGFLFGVFHSSPYISPDVGWRKYRSSTLVGFRHPVTALHALFSSVFSSWV